MIALALIVSATFATCPSAAFVTLEGDHIAAVTWTERSATQVRSHSVLNQTLIVDSTVELRPDATASKSTAVHQVYGDAPDMNVSRDLGTGAVFWSDFVASSLEQVVLRAHQLGIKTATIPGASLWTDRRTEL